MPVWRAPDVAYNETVDAETRRRIRLSVYAYAYEFRNKSLVDDGEFDAMCGKVDLAVDTRRPDLDGWFRKNFDPSTGLWIHDHPELDKIKNLYDQFYS